VHDQPVIIQCLVGHQPNMGAYQWSLIIHIFLRIWTGVILIVHLTKVKYLTLSSCLLCKSIGYVTYDLDQNKKYFAWKDESHSFKLDFPCLMHDAFVGFFKIAMHRIFFILFMCFCSQSLSRINEISHLL